MDVGKVAVITGASSGIGKETAKALITQGWRVIGQGRDAGRSASAQAEIAAEAANGGSVELLMADLAELGEVMRLADEIKARTDRIDVLLNNAGGVRSELAITSEGNEATFAGNHLGHFLLARELMPLLEKAAADSPAGATRVISTSSRAHMHCQGVDWSDPQMLANWNSVPAYAFAKLANILFTRELAARLEGTGIVAHAFHPGVVDSNFAIHGGQGMVEYMAKSPELIGPAEAARTALFLATSPEAGQSTGGYWSECKPESTLPLARDDDAAAMLWQISQELVAKARY